MSHTYDVIIVDCRISMTSLYFGHYVSAWPYDPFGGRYSLGNVWSCIPVNAYKYRSWFFRQLSRLTPCDRISARHFSIDSSGRLNWDFKPDPNTNSTHPYVERNLVCSKVTAIPVRSFPDLQLITLAPPRSRIIAEVILWIETFFFFLA